MNRLAASSPHLLEASPTPMTSPNPLMSLASERPPTTNCQQKQPPWRFRAPTAADPARVRSRCLQFRSRKAMRRVEDRTNSASTLRFPPRSIGPYRGRVVQQEIAWATQCVVRIGGLRDGRSGREVVIVISRGTATAERAARAARCRARAAIIALTIRAMENVLRAALAISA